VDSERPLVSVVIPCLNRAHLLVPTIESVLQQDYPRLECIVVDGGSTDGTLDILHRYDDRIDWVSEPDHGHADAINKGWRRSRGEILAWLNADDLWVVPNAVTRAVAYLQAHPEVDVIYGECDQVDVGDNLVGMCAVQEWDLEYAVEYCDHCIPQPAAFIRRRILERVGWLDVDFYQKKDHELWLRIGLVGTIQHIPVLLAHERIHPGNLGYEGVSSARACVQLTKKFFTLPNVPESLKKKRRRATSNAYLRGIDYAFYHGRHWPLIAAYTLKALVADLSNASGLLRHVNRHVETASKDDSRLRWVLLTSIPLKVLWRTARKAECMVRLVSRGGR